MIGLEIPCLLTEGPRQHISCACFASQVAAFATLQAVAVLPPSHRSPTLCDRCALSSAQSLPCNLSSLANSHRVQGGVALCPNPTRSPSSQGRRPCGAGRGDPGPHACPAEQACPRTSSSTRSWPALPYPNHSTCALPEQACPRTSSGTRSSPACPSCTSRWRPSRAGAGGHGARRVRPVAQLRARGLRPSRARKHGLHFGACLLSACF